MERSSTTSTRGLRGRRAVGTLMGMDVTRIAIVHIPVADQERSLAFYRDVLVMDIAIDNLVMPGMRWLQLHPRAPGANLVLADWDGIGAPGSVQGLILQVDDARAAAEHLRQQGITPAREDLGTPFGDFVELADPDGNRLALWQPAPGMDIASIDPG